MYRIGAGGGDPFLLVSLGYIFNFFSKIANASTAYQVLQLAPFYTATRAIIMSIEARCMEHCRCLRNPFFIIIIIIFF